MRHSRVPVLVLLLAAAAAGACGSDPASDPDYGPVAAFRGRWLAAAAASGGGCVPDTTAMDVLPREKDRADVTITLVRGQHNGQCQLSRSVWRGSFLLTGDGVLAGAATPAPASSLAIPYAAKLTAPGELLLTQGFEGGQDTQRYALRRE